MADLVWVKFLFCGALIVYSGSRLSLYGDIIAEKTGLGRTWIGLVLMAMVTSLPELVMGVSAVVLVNVPNIALGDAIGSCVFNLLLLALLDILHGPEPIFSKADQGHVLSASFGIMLLTLVLLGILAAHLGYPLPVLWFGIYTPAILLLYLLAMRVTYMFEQRKIAAYLKESAALELRYDHVSTREAVQRYILHALVIVGAGTWLPAIGEELARRMQWTQSFVGGLFIAATTSLPEVVTSVSAIRLGALNMGVSNLLGSNIFNMGIVAVDDLFYAAGPILATASAAQMIPGIVAVLMTAIASAGLIYRSQKKALMRLSWDGIALVGMYAIYMLLLYNTRAAGG